MISLYEIKKIEFISCGPSSIQAARCARVGDFKRNKVPQADHVQSQLMQDELREGSIKFSMNVDELRV